ncbi:MAG: DNA recombination protein RmuC [Akkermansiaceae bacterium]
MLVALSQLSQNDLMLIGASVLGGFFLAFLIFRPKAVALLTQLEERERSQRKEVSEFQALEASLRSDLSELRSTESILLKRQGELETALQAQQTRNLETQNLLNTAEQRFTDTFKALSTDALKLSQQQFMNLAKSTFQTEQKQAQGELEKRELAVAHLVKPVAESLEKIQGRIGDLEKAREGAYATLREQVGQLHQSQQGLERETSQLVKALRQPVGRGQWGEMQLQRVVEMAGMQQHCDFTTQTTTTDDEGKRLRPDLVVNLPGGQQIVVDSKAPMAAYLDALEAQSDDERAAHLVKHAQQVSVHIRQLSSKKYQAQFPTTPEFVVLFLPSESFFSAALTQDSTLLEQGVDQNVILATPTTLIALLRSVAYGWRQEKLAENARLISDAGRELHKRLATFAGHLAKVGRSLEGSVKSYNSAVSSLETRIFPSARKFETLEASESQTALEAPSDIASLAKQPRNLDVSPEEGEDQFQGFAVDEKSQNSQSSQKASSAASDFRAALNEEES